MSARVLIAEDEAKIARLLQDYFAAEGMQVDWVERGDAVLERVRRQPPDLLLLDLMLPGMSGLDVCRALGPRPDLAIIMLTARVDEIDRLLGLELGADDYICKPFSPREVVARAKAVLRRLRPEPAGGASSALRLGRLTLDPAAHEARVDDQALQLTPLEFALLRTFLEHPREVIARERLLQRARGTDYAGYARNIDSHMKNLRRKLREPLGGADPFRTVYGCGYALEHAALEPGG